MGSRRGSKPLAIEGEVNSEYSGGLMATSSKELIIFFYGV
jgi:hypothetical protein